MAIIVDDKKRIFTLQTKSTTYQMKVGRFDYLYHVYYGKKIDNQDLSYLVYDGTSDFAPYPHQANDRNGSLTLASSEYPTVGIGDLGSVALDIENSDGTHVVNLKYKDYQVIDGKYSLNGLPTFFANNENVKTLKLTLLDEVSNIEVNLLYGIFEDEDVITRAVKIYNLSSKNIILKKAQSLSLDFPFGMYDLIHFHGRWSGERNLERLPLTHNTTTFGSNYGVSSAKENPGFILTEKTTTETNGDCYGFNLVYSGNFRATAEKGTLGRDRITLGLGDNQFLWQLQPNDVFETPEAIISFSDNGFTQLSHNFHNMIRENLCHSKYVHEKRPVLINNWEATYFDFTGDKLVQIAKSAKDIGVDMFVLDDGWFGNRSDDNRGLGDWNVNEDKLGCTLDNLVKRINNIGLDFGIWFEPEMVNEDSNLYKEHPEWVLKFPMREPLLSRNQLVLDMSNTEVQDYLFECISKVLDSANIKYIKWDMNRPVTDWYSKKVGNRQGELQHRYVLGLYRILDKLTKKYSDVMIEGCASGGARFDLGMLAYVPQIWTSDNTDAINRLDIQYGTSFFYPPSVMGSHVSVSPNQQIGRITPLKTRAAVAMAGTYGYELDVTRMDSDDKQEAKLLTNFYKKIQKLTFSGDYYRLLSPLNENSNLTAWQIVSKDKSESVVTIVARNVTGNDPFHYLKLHGLDFKSEYIINDETYSGSALMNAGLKVPQLIGNYPSKQIYIKKAHSDLNP